MKLWKPENTREPTGDHFIHARTELGFRESGTGWIPPSPLVQFKLYQGEVLPYNPSTRDWVIHPVRDPSSTNSVRAWYMLYSMNAPFGRTRVTRGWNRDLVLNDHTFSNLSGMERECARTVRSSSKASNPTFQPLIGSQEPTPEVLVPVINLEDLKKRTTTALPSDYWLRVN